MQQEDGRGHSTIKTVQGVLRRLFHTGMTIEYCRNVGGTQALLLECFLTSENLACVVE